MKSIHLHARVHQIRPVASFCRGLGSLLATSLVLGSLAHVPDTFAAAKTSPPALAAAESFSGTTEAPFIPTPLDLSGAETVSAEDTLGLEVGYGVTLYNLERLLPHRSPENYDHLKLVSVSPANLFKKAYALDKRLVLKEQPGATGTAVIELAAIRTSGKKERFTIKVKVERGEIPVNRNKPLLTVLIHGYSFNPVNEVSPWIFKLCEDIAASNRRLGLAKLNPEVLPTELKDVEALMEKNAPRAAYLKAWRASQDFLAIDWTDESNDSVHIFSGVGIDEATHRARVLKCARAYCTMIEAWVENETETKGASQVDLLIVGHSLGTMVERELLRMLSNSALIGKVDHAKAVYLDSVAVKPNPEIFYGTYLPIGVAIPGVGMTPMGGQVSTGSNTHDRRALYHPEYFGFLRSVMNLTQTLDPILDAGPAGFLIPYLGGAADHIDSQLRYGTPLDGEWGGGPRGFFNGQVRVFGLEGAGASEVTRFSLRRGNGKQAQGNLTALAGSASGRLLAVADDEGRVDLRNTTDYAATGQFRLPHPVRDVQFLGGEEYVLTATPKNGKIQLTRTADGVRAWTGEHAEVKRIAVSADNKWFVTGSENGTLKVWSETTPKTFAEVARVTTAHKDSVTALALASSGVVYSTSVDKSLTVYDAARSSIIQRVALEAVPHDLRLAADGRLVMAVGRKLLVANLEADGKVADLNVVHARPESLTRLDFSADGKVLAVGGKDSEVWFYRYPSLELVRRLDNPMLPVRELVLSPDGQRVTVLPIDLPGGPVSDYEINDGVKALTPMWERWVKPWTAHKVVPDVYREWFVKQDAEPFFWRRFKADAIKPGYSVVLQLPPSTPGDAPASEVPGAPVVLNRPAAAQLNLGDETLQLELTDVFGASAGGPVKFEVRISRPDLVMAQLEGPRLSLRAQRPGEVTVFLAAQNAVGRAEANFAVVLQDDRAKATPSLVSGLEQAEAATRSFSTARQTAATALQAVESSLTGGNKALNTLLTLLADAQRAAPSVTRAEQTLAARNTELAAATKLLANASTELANATKRNNEAQAALGTAKRNQAQAEKAERDAERAINNATKAKKAAAKQAWDQAKLAAAQARKATEAANSTAKAAEKALDRTQTALQQARKQCTTAEANAKTAATQLTTARQPADRYETARQVLLAQLAGFVKATTAATDAHDRFGTGRTAALQVMPLLEALSSNSVTLPTETKPLAQRASRARVALQAELVAYNDHMPRVARVKASHSALDTAVRNVPVMRR